MEAHRIYPEEVEQRLDAGLDVVLVDTRSPEDWARSNQIIPGAIRIPADEIADHLGDLPHAATIITYCS